MKTPGSGVIPAEVAIQWTISSKGERIIKRCSTHDTSRPCPSGLSVNLMCNKFRRMHIQFMFTPNFQPTTRDEIERPINDHPEKQD